ncbi:hypothetical protein [Marinifilum sp.]|uniref:hypothetical protein n=1 Tax=Marinifilum sp. TaxID=2033137 RepID=UPI003BA89FAF
MKLKINLIPVGAVLGIIVPLFSILLAYAVKFQSELTIKEFVDSLLIHRIYTKVVALGVYFGNIVLFFLFVKLDYLKAARGVLLATILYTFAIVVFRFGM